MNAETPAANSESLAGVPARSRWLRTRTLWLARQVSQCAAVAVVAFVSYFVVSHFFVQSVQVVGVSMQPTLHNSEHYLLNRWIYYLRSPRVGEVVVIRDPADHGYSVKRVVAMPGDRVIVQDGIVEVNGRVLTEPYLPKGTRTWPDGSGSRQLMVCGQNEYIVLGDNRLNSADSRSYGPIPRGDVLGLLIR